ncbi:MAG TPA: hypothetical protein PK636_10960, partial [bacterium]|nr:hypothetical protein [bacterium]
LVADAFNNRVMVFDEVPAWNNASCQYVIGQPDAEGYLVANQGLVGGYAEAYTLYEPRRVCVDGGKVFVADRFNHRVLIYDSIPDWNNHSASVVVGQPDFIENKINQDYPCMEGGTGCPAQNTLQEPCGVYARDGRLFVSDTYNHRVLIYNSIPAWNNATADVVIGQADFFSGDPNRGLGAAYADTLDEPFGSVFYDGTRLFVPDSGNNRVLIYNSLPTENGQSADVVLGQPTMRDNFVNQFPPGPSPPPTPSGTVAPTTIPTPPPPPTSRTMYWPDGVFYQDGRLYVSDTHNNRVLIFLEFTPTPTPSPVPSATPTASPPPRPPPSPSASPAPAPPPHP